MKHDTKKHDTKKNIEYMLFYYSDETLVCWFVPEMGALTIVGNMISALIQSPDY